MNCLHSTAYYASGFICLFLIVSLVFLIKKVVKKQSNTLIFGFNLHRHVLKIIVLIAFLAIIKAVLYVPTPTIFQIVVSSDASIDYVEH
jgi:heme/copper-type cytochrome/quinol oxidase subunit 2